MSVTYFDFNKQKIPNSKLRTTTLPTPKEFWDRAQRQDHPGMHIRNLYHPAVQSSVTMVSEKYRASLPESMALPSVKISLNKMERVESRSDIELQKYIPTGKRYHPDVGGSPFIPGSARPVPPVLAQSAIRSCAEFCALKRAQGGDPTPIKVYFRKMWGLPESFDPEDYSPVVKPDRAKPWLRANKPQNYEVIIYPTQQSMITVKLGNTNSIVLGNKLAIDWDLIRVHLRQIASRVFFCEPGRLEELKKHDVELYFQLRYENFEIESDQLTIFNHEAPAVCNALTHEELNLLATKNTKIIAQPLRGLIAQALPEEALDEMQSTNEEKIIKISNAPSMLDKYLDELSSNHDHGPFTIISAPKKSFQTAMSLRSIMKWSIRNWILRDNDNLQAMTQAMGNYEYMDSVKAMDILIEKMDWSYLDKVFIAWKRLRSDMSDPKAGAELRNMFFDSNVTKVKYELDTLATLAKKSNFKKCTAFLEICSESYRSARVNFSYLSIHDFVRHIEKPADITIPNLKNIAYKKISDAYKTKYISKAKFHMEQFKKYKENHEKFKAIKYQMRSKIYPLLDSKSRPWSLLQVFQAAMEKFVKKRKRLHRWWETEREEKLSLMERLTRFDDKAKTHFSDFYKDCLKLSELTWQDIDTYFLSEDAYSEKWHHNQKFKKKANFIRSNLHSNLTATTKESFSKMNVESDLFSKHDKIKPDIEKENNDELDFYSEDDSQSEEEGPDIFTIKQPAEIEVPKKDKDITMNIGDDGGLDLDDLLDDYDNEEAVFNQTIVISDFLESKGCSADMRVFTKVMNENNYSFDINGFNDYEALEVFWSKHGMQILSETRDLWQLEKDSEKTEAMNIPQAEDLY